MLVDCWFVVVGLFLVVVCCYLFVLFNQNEALLREFVLMGVFLKDILRRHALDQTRRDLSQTKQTHDRGDNTATN